MRLADKRARRTLTPARPRRPLVLDTYIRSLARRAPKHRRYFYYPRAGRHLGGALRDEDYLAGKSIACCYVPSTFLAIGRCARPCERARAEAGTAAADTARRSYRHSLISRVIATVAATSPRANRTITRTRYAKQGAGSDTRLIPRHADARTSDRPK
jgi:hypothetical protein